MPPRRATCQICSSNESKYSCSKCLVLYCSVACFKRHKESSCGAGARGSKPQPPPSFDDAPSDAQEAPRRHADTDEVANRGFAKTKPLRPLTSLNWPYVPEESAYPDPLKRDDPKPLQLHQYEAIATSQAVRRALATHPRLKDTLRHIDSLRGTQREEALQHALGVSRADAGSDSGANDRMRKESNMALADDDRKALRELAEAVEAAVRGGREDILGLDWSESEQ